MKRNQNIIDPKLEGTFINLQLMKAANVMNDPYHRFLASLGLSPGDGGRRAERFIALQRKMLMGRAIANLIAGPPLPKLPKVDPRKAIQIGFVRSLKQWFLYPVLAMCQHLLVSGPIGRGKTNAIWFWLLQLLGRGLDAVFFDYKNEGRRLLNRLSDVAVLRIDQLRENMIAPVGDPKTYFTVFTWEFSRLYGIRRETRRKLLKLLLQMYAGLKPGQACFSVADVWKCIRLLAEETKDPAWNTLLEALEALMESLGRNAFVRSGPRVQERCSTVVYEYQGLPPSFLEFHLAIMTHRMLARAYEAGHSTDARVVVVIDEGRFAFGRELAGETASGYVPAPVRLISQSRSGGFIVLVGSQELGGIQELVPANVGGYLCVGAQTASEQRGAGQRLRMQEDRWPVLGSLDLGEGWFVSHLQPSAVPIRIPECNMGSYPSDAVVAELMRNTMDWLDEHTIFAPPDSEVMVPISYLTFIGEEDEEAPAECGNAASILSDHIALLKAIIETAGNTLSTRELYHTAGISPEKGGRLKRDLLQNNLVRIERVSSGGRPREVLVVTDKGKEFINEIR